jgi:hypothetical protein
MWWHMKGYSVTTVSTEATGGCPYECSAQQHVGVLMSSVILDILGSRRSGLTILSVHTEGKVQDCMNDNSLYNGGL